MPAPTPTPTTGRQRHRHRQPRRRQGRRSNHRRPAVRPLADQARRGLRLRSSSEAAAPPPLPRRPRRPARCGGSPAPPTPATSTTRSATPAAAPVPTGAPALPRCSPHPPASTTPTPAPASPPGPPAPSTTCAPTPSHSERCRTWGRPPQLEVPDDHTHARTLRRWSTRHSHWCYWPASDNKRPGGHSVQLGRQRHLAPAFEGDVRRAA